MSLCTSVHSSAREGGWTMLAATVKKVMTLDRFVVEGAVYSIVLESCIIPPPPPKCS